MKVEKLERVCLDVKNLAQAEKLFSDLFGITFFRVPSEKIEIRTTGQGDARLQKSKIEVAVSPGGMELIESTPPAEKEGVRSFHFKVSDLEEAKAEMKKKGIRLITELKVGGVKQAIFNPLDLHGARIILLEYRGSLKDAMLGKRG